MTRELKDELIAKATKVLTRNQLERYRNFINNYEIESARNDERIKSRYTL